MITRNEFANSWDTVLDRDQLIGAVPPHITWEFRGVPAAIVFSSILELKRLLLHAPFKSYSFVRDRISAISVRAQERLIPPFCPVGAYDMCPETGIGDIVVQSGFYGALRPIVYTYWIWQQTGLMFYPCQFPQFKAAIGGQLPMPETMWPLLDTFVKKYKPFIYHDLTANHIRRFEECPIK